MAKDTNIEPQQTSEDLQREILKVQLETARIQLERTREDNLVYEQRKAALQAQRRQAQENIRNEEAKRARAQELCSHRQGARPTPNDPNSYFNGTGPSALTVSRVFFSWNQLIQCPICQLKLQTPNPSLQSRRLLEGETEKQRDERVKKYFQDKARFDRLLAEANSNGLPPMAGPQWEFMQEGIPIVPVIR